MYLQRYYNVFKSKFQTGFQIFYQKKGKFLKTSQNPPYYR